MTRVLLGVFFLVRRRIDVISLVFTQLSLTKIRFFILLSLVWRIDRNGTFHGIFLGKALKTRVSFMSANCSICLAGKPDQECGECDMKFHTSCYAQDSCHHFHSQCVACPSTIGPCIPLQIDTRSKIHLVCATWINQAPVEPADWINGMPLPNSLKAAAFTRECYLCSDPDLAKYGIKLQCDAHGCKRFVRLIIEMMRLTLTW